MARRPARHGGVREARDAADPADRADELYWRFLAAAAGFLCLGVLSLRERAELWMQAAGAAIILEIVASLTR